MKKSTLPLYLLAGVAGILAIIAGFSGANILWMTSVKAAVITLAAAGFVMCSTGVVARFVTKMPAHPVTILSYLIGLLALFTGIVQVFSIQMPFFGDAKTALIILTCAIVLKVAIGRLGSVLKPVKA